MKIFNVTHITNYDFSKEVYLEPHIVKLIPKPSRAQKIISSNIEIFPEPASSYLNTDIYYNPALYCNFSEKTDKLKIISSFEVEFNPEDNPFSYIVYPFECSSLPLHYPPSCSSELDSAKRPYYRSSTVEQLARKLAEAAGMNTSVYLSILARCLYDTINHTVRNEGTPLHPEDTLKNKEGSCRDTAVLYMEACRYMGIASRFVSGYVMNEGNDETAGHLHAWVEVFMPGAGWIGYDPSLGLACNSSYVAVVSSCNPVDAAPVCGTFRGNEAASCLSYNISIKESSYITN